MIGIMLATVLSASAQPTPDFQTCAQIDSNRKRLACYDQAAGRNKNDDTSDVLADTPNEQPQTVAKASNVSRFGLPDLRPDEPEVMSGRVTEVSVNRRGVATFVLSDGQVWRQLDADGYRIKSYRFDRVKDVTIEKRGFGGYRMVIEPLGKSVLVNRQK